jgi:hypothetical protein
MAMLDASGHTNATSFNHPYASCRLYQGFHLKIIR